MNEVRNNEKVRNAHPGWSVQFEDGTWLGGAHGWFRTEDAFYADIYESEARAADLLEDIRKDSSYGDDFQLQAKIIPAWEPLCENLRFRVKSLEAANKLSPSKIFDISFQLEQVLQDLKNYDDEE